MPRIRERMPPGFTVCWSPIGFHISSNIFLPGHTYFIFHSISYFIYDYYSISYFILQCITIPPTYSFPFIHISHFIVFHIQYFILRCISMYNLQHILSRSYIFQSETALLKTKRSRTTVNCSVVFPPTKAVFRK